MSGATVSMTTVDQVSCIAFEVMSSSGDETNGDVALGVSFAVAFVVGCLIALVASILIFRHLARKDKVFSSTESKDIENSDEMSTTNSYRRLKHGSIANEDWGTELQRRDVPVPNELHISLHVIAFGDRINVDSRDFLSMASTSDRELELVRLDMVGVSDLERSIVEERINAKMLCMREILAVQLKRNKLTKTQFYDTLQKVFCSVYDVIYVVQRQNDVNSELLKKKTKDSQVVEMEMMKIYPRNLALVTSAVQKTDEIFRKSLIECTNLTPDEVKAVAESLSENMARLESRFRDERLQQTICLEDGHMRRKCLSESVELREDSMAAEISGRQNAIFRVLESLVLETTMSERAKTDLQKHFTDDLKAIHSRLSLEFQRTKLNQATLLRQSRHEKLSRLNEELRKQQSQFFAMLDRTGADSTLAQAYLELRSEARRQRNDVEEDLDVEEAEAVESIYTDVERISQKSLIEADDRLTSNLRSQGRLSERDANNALRLYQTQLEQEQRMMSMERRERQRQIHEKLPSTNQKSEEDTLRRLGSEEEELRTKLEKLLLAVCRTQTLLTLEAKKTVQRLHAQKLVGVTNHLVMANRRSQKTLIWLNCMRKRMTEASSHSNEDESKNNKEKKTKKSLMERMRGRKVDDCQQLERLAKDFEEFIRLEANQMEEEILKDYDRFLSEIIGHQVAAEARKEVLTNVRKDMTICKLEDRIMNELDRRLDHRDQVDGYLDLISQQHLTEISEMIEEMGLARSRRDEQIIQKMESRQHTREREIASDLNQQARNQWNENKNFLVEHFERIAFQQLFDDSLSNLKLDCAVEVEQMRDEVSTELENELHQQLTEQKKVFLAQVIALTKMTKDVIEDVITGAVTEAGGDDKQASKLLKELLLEVQRAKVNSGFEHRPPMPKTKSTNSLLLSDRSIIETKSQRSKTDLGLTYPLSTATHDALDRPKSRLQSYPNPSYLISDDDEKSSIDHQQQQRRQQQQQQQRSLSAQRPRNAFFKRSAEV